MRRALLGSTAATLLALLAVGAGVLLQAVPATEAVRLRNAFLASAHDRSAFEWEPAATPPDFRLESATVPAEIRDFVAAAASGGDAVTRAGELAARLLVRGERGDPIQQPTIETFRRITTTGGGYCADYTQVFNALAYAARLPVREWGMSFDGFGGDGHAFNEIFAEELGQWVMVDVFYGFVPLDAATGRPLSALEFRDRLHAGATLEDIRIHRVATGNWGFRSDEAILNYYRRGMYGLFLWWGNDGLDSESWLASLPPAAGQGLAVLLGQHPRMKILAVPQNRRAIEALERTRDALLALGFAGGTLTLALLLQGYALITGRRDRQFT